MTYPEVVCAGNPSSNNVAVAQDQLIKNNKPTYPPHTSLGGMGRVL